MSMYAVVNPANGETLKEYPEISGDALDAAIAKAWEAREALGSLSVAERAAKVKRVAELHVERRETLAAIVVKEMGKPMEQALGEVDFCGDIYGYYAERAEDFLKDEPIELLAGEGTAVIRRTALGPLLGIMPWNFPYYQVARFAGPNLIVGNSILLKPAPQCPESAEAIQAMYDEAGFPEGAFQTILATNEQIAETVIPDPRVRGVSVTGSERAGSAVAEVAGRNLKKVVLELGGSDPFILLATEDLDEVVDSAVEARLDNTGQSCNAAKRFIVADDLYDDFLAKFTEKMKATEPGDPTEDAAMGPLSSSTAADRLQDQLDRAKAQGAEVVLDGGRKDNFFGTTVLAGISPESDAYREEFFGPVASVYRVASEDEAVAVANDTPFGLGSYVFTTDSEQADRVADSLDTGMVFVNGVLADGAELPFGGVKRSGFGRELGPYGMDEFVNKKLIRVLK
ncbi:MAG: succinate-semialdehyde dehydrogenase / glutarate-semialdehyde dehydrogenase [Solirubrobacterales bacterium]|nr:succinate-semialdehyde dehydrogenase / glutarate-semialdehyde dehydrogenase [Solirubrobacterales bacterium]